MTLTDLYGAIDADNVAIVLPETDIRVTYGALRQQVTILASALVEAGVQRTDRVVIALPNGLSLVVAILAASSAGVAVPIKPSNDRRFESTFAIEADRDGGLHVTHTTRNRADSGSDPLSDSGADEIAVVLHTRGTTGPPKRVGLSHANLSITATHVATALALRPDDVTLSVMPIAHVHGLVTTSLATLATGGTLVIPSAFHPLQFWRIARDHRVTWYSAGPQLHQWLLARTADPGSRRPPGAARLRFIRSAGSILPSAVRHTLESAFGAPVIDAYEVTEAAGDTSAARIAILDPAGHPVEADTRGEVALAGPTVARGYENDPETTRKFFVDGWFRTGDLGYLDRGHLTLIRD